MLNIECGQTIDPSQQNIDTSSSGTDWRQERHKDSDITLYTECPKELSQTYIDLTPVDPGLNISQIEDDGEAREKILSAPLYRCNGFGVRWCPLYEGDDKVS